MPRKRRRGKIPAPAWERHHSAIGRQLLGRSAQFYATVGVVLLTFAALGVIGYAIAADRIAAHNRPGSTAVRVADKEYTVSYLTTRVKSAVQQSGSAASQLQPQTIIAAMIQQIEEEGVVLKFASDEGQSATEDDVNTEIATRIGTKKDDASFQSRFQEELAKSGLTEDQYREMATASVLRTKLVDKFTAAAPATAESIHYRRIFVADQTQADDLRKQIENGADFAQLAKDKSQDTGTKSQGGDAGWVPRGVLDKGVEDYLFAQDINKVTTYPTQSGVFIYQVLEKQADRQVEDSQKSSLGQKKYRDWRTGKQSGLDVQDFVLNDQDNYNYVKDHAGFPGA